MKAKMIEEHPTHFLMHDGTASFRVAKKGSEPLHDKIRALGQGMAEGGGVEVPVDAGVAPAPTASFVPTDGGVGPPIINGVVPQSGAGGSGSDSGAAAWAANSAPLAPAPASNWTPPLSRGMEGGKEITHWTGPKEEKKSGKPAESSRAQPPKPESRPVPAHAATAKPQGPSREETAVSQISAAKEQEARDQVKALGAASDEMHAHQLQQKRDVDEADRYGKDILAKHQSVLDDMARQDSSVDPGRFWASRSTGQKITGIIGLAIGAIGAGPDGVNRAAQMMDKAIDRDIDAQKSEHEIRLKRGLAQAEGYRSAYGMAHQMTGDKLAANELAKSTSLSIAENQLKTALASSAGAQANPNGQLLLSELQTKKQEAEAKAQQMLSEAHLNNAKAGHVAAGAGAGASGGRAALARLSTAWKQGGGWSGLVSQYVPGTGASNVESQLDGVAASIAAEEAGGKAPRPARIQQIREALPRPGMSQSVGDQKMKALYQMMQGQHGAADDEQDLEE